MKVLFVQKMNGISGSEKYYMNLLPLLKQKGIDVHFCCVQQHNTGHNNRTFLEFLSENGIPYHIINFHFTFSPRIIHQLAQLTKQEKFQIVQTNLVHADFWGAWVKKLYKPSARFICMFHGYDEKIQKQGGFNAKLVKKDAYYFIVKFSAQQMDHCLAMSKGLGRFLVDAGLVRESKLTAIQYGFDFVHAKLFFSKGKTYRYSPHQIVVIGRLVPYKQQHILIEILPELKKTIPDVVLVLVGAGPMEEEWRELAKRLGVERHVVFQGFLTNVYDVIAASDVLVMPSKSEGFGIVILEGWYNKKAVIAFDVAAPNEVITHNHDGLLLPLNEKGVLTQSLEKLLTDESERNRLGSNGYNTLSTVFSNERMLEATVQFYQSILTQS
jgi:glycosyltransferase involved in cell wall biosynthesis